MNRLTRFNKIAPMSGDIKIIYTLKEYPEHDKVVCHFHTYEDFGTWICSQYNKINIISLSDKN